ncbi:MAG: hypothetical protein EA425_13375 [Puniceicoccaceae bacterium]|nr:MAG: hypothetical protein EA425_13375 [Puniceicoccaceae bacterium]
MPFSRSPLAALPAGLSPRLALLLILVAFGAAPTAAAGVNAWPFYVGGRDDAATGAVRWQAVGPFVFEEPAGAFQAVGLRPLFGRFQSATGPDATHTHLLYPVFNHYRSEGYREWNLFHLLRYRSLQANDRHPDTGISSLELFPVLFHRRGVDAEDSYFGIFPLGGSVHRKLGYDRIHWALFPLYARFERGPATTTATPWPFLRVTRGEGARGFELWPLGGFREIESRYRLRYAVWPLIFHRTSIGPDDEVRTDHGFLPFYSASDAPGMTSRTWVWPFFGYTTIDEPAWHEQRFLWPLWVRGRGEERHLDRWAPFYTHSVSPHREKRWIAWPLYRHERWEERGLAIDKTQFLYFVYWNMRQESLIDPEAPPAVKSHLWPLASYWDNGAGRRQFQLFSPLEVFFQHNQKVRTLYSPLFSVYRFEQRDQGDVSHELLFRLLRYHSGPGHHRLELGPLLTLKGGTDAEVAGFSLLGGLLRHQRSGDESRWGAFWVPPAAASPAFSP